MKDEQITQLSILGVVSIVGLIAAIGLLSTPTTTTPTMGVNGGEGQQGTVVGQASSWEDIFGNTPSDNTPSEDSTTDSENTYQGEPQTSSQSQAQTFSQNLLQTVQNEEITVEIPVCIEKVEYLTPYEDEIIEDAYRIAETVAGNQGVFLERADNSDDCVEVVFADIISYVALKTGYSVDDEEVVERRNRDIDSDALTNRRPQESTYYYRERQAAEDVNVVGENFKNTGESLSYNKALVNVNGLSKWTIVNNELGKGKQEAFKELFSESLAKTFLHEVLHSRGLLHVWDLPILSEEQQEFVRNEDIETKANVMAYASPTLYPKPLDEGEYGINRRDTLNITGVQKYIVNQAQNQNSQLHAIMQTENRTERFESMKQWYDEHLTEDMQIAYSAGIEEIVTGRTRTTAQNNFFN